MRRSRKLCVLLACALVVPLLNGCGGNTDQPSGGELAIGVTSFADTLEPTEQYFSWVVSRYGVGETLVRFDEEGELAPCLAESWAVSDDHLTWTFQIREGVKFSNGDMMTPEMVKSSLERTFNLSPRARQPSLSRSRWRWTASS